VDETSVPCRRSERQINPEMFAAVSSELRLLSKNLTVRYTSYSTVYILQHGIHLTARYTSYSTVYILQQGIHLTARYTSYSTVYILQHGIHLTARYTSYSTVYILQHGIHLTARYTSYSAVYILQRGIHTNDYFYHGATAPVGQGLIIEGFTITLRHTTVGRTPLDE
jgi:uncharacterized membrane protein